eukprot:487311_1
MIQQKQEKNLDDITVPSPTPYYIGGIACLFLAVGAQTAYAEVMQSFKNGSYNHLYFIRYCAMTGYTLAIIPWFFLNKRGINKLKKQQSKLLNQNDSVIAENIEPHSLPANSVNSVIQNASLIERNKYNYEKSFFQFMYTIKYGIILMALDSFLCGYVWYLSLDYTTVAANNTMFQSQCVFTLLFSALVLKTKITVMKIFGMICAVAGVAMVSYGTTTESDNTVQTTWYGYVACLIAMLLQSAALVITKYFGNKYFRYNFEMADNFVLMIGMGMCVFICFWPGLIVLDITRIEIFAFPKTYDDVITVVSPILIDSVYIGSLLTGITLTGPVFMSIGTLMIIPVSFIMDVWLHGLKVTLLAIIGSLLIFIGFIVIETPTKKLIPCVKHKRETES